MSEQNGSQDSQDSGPDHGAEEAGFHRGSALSLFQSDRVEDLLALGFAMAIALYVYVNY